MDAWKELSPARRTMLETVISHDGVSEYSARLSFARGDISWGIKRKLLDWRVFRGDRELFATDAGRTAVSARK